MKRDFAFATNDALEAYFEKVLAVLVADFGISEDEALGRINRSYGNYDVLADPTLTHEWAKDTAYQIYYGPNQAYWKPGAILEKLPYP
jgi:hypothetical protein